VKLGFTTLGCPEWTIEEVARNAASLGFDGVELRVRRVWGD
jgi:sugar phosphate isomerase/epimerase